MQSSVHLIGGGWNPAALPTLYGPFLDEAGNNPRIACVVLDEGDGPAQFQRWAAALRTVAPCRSFPVLVPIEDRLDMRALDDADGLLICGGLTPAYAAAVAPAAAELRNWLTDRPFCGFSAGAAVAAETAITGGWLFAGVPIAPEDASEDLEELTTTAGLGWCRSPSMCIVRNGERCRGCSPPARTPASTGWPWTRTPEPRGDAEPWRWPGSVTLTWPGRTGSRSGCADSPPARQFQFAHTAECRDAAAGWKQT